MSSFHAVSASLLEWLAAAAGLGACDDGLAMMNPNRQKRVVVVVAVLFALALVVTMMAPAMY